MKDYIDFCVEQRKKAELEGNDFLVEFWKLMMNSVFGKTMENIWKRIDFCLVNNSKKLWKLMDKPFFKYITVYVLGSDNEGDDEFLVGVQMSKPKILLNKPIYTGQCILDNSKRKMYEFVYGYCLPKWGINNFRICQTDTDSVICEIKTEDLYADFAPDVPEVLDTSKYKKTDFDGTIIPKVIRKFFGKNER